MKASGDLTSSPPLSSQEWIAELLATHWPGTQESGLSGLFQNVSVCVGESTVYPANMSMYVCVCVFACDAWILMYVCMYG